MEAESQAFVTCYHIYALQQQSSSIFKRLQMGSGLHFTKRIRHRRVTGTKQLGNKRKIQSDSTAGSKELNK